MEVLNNSPNMEYEIHQVGCNVCKPSKDPNTIQDNSTSILPPNPLTPSKQSGNSMVIWIIVILIAILLLGILVMRRPQNRSRR